MCYRKCKHKKQSSESSEQRDRVLPCLPSYSSSPPLSFDENTGGEKLETRFKKASRFDLRNISTPILRQVWSVDSFIATRNRSATIEMRMLLLLGVVTWHVTNSNAMSVAPTMEALDAVTGSVNTFANTFFKNVAEENSGNLICSPISASMVLSMASFGARGNTEKQLRTALALPSDDTMTKNGFQSLVDSFKNYNEVVLRLANKIYVATGFEMKPEFKGVTETYFRSEAESVNFGKPAEASKTINDWCEAQTNDRIKDLIKPDDLSSDTALVLVNAVYFKGNWADKFNPNDTQPRPFHVDAKTVKDVPTMHRFGKYRYGELPELKAKFVELPYKSKDFSDSVSMFIILPDEIDGLSNLEKNLDKVTVNQLLRGSMRDVNLYLPKFKIESSFNLQGPLDKMGLTDMFTNAANFTGITDAPPLKVSKVVQKAFIEVNEEGSEAAAATGVMITMRCMMIPKEMKIDRPFIFRIISGTSSAEGSKDGTPLFTGSVSDPKN